MQDVVRTVHQAAGWRRGPQPRARLDDPHRAAGAGHPDLAPDPREEEVLQLIADGLSTTEVAAQLFISGKTVKNHLASIYDKLDARDRTQAVLAAVRIGIIRLH